MPVNGVGASTEVPVVDRDKVGFAGLTPETFLKLLIAELQNQDPTEPMSNEQILGQISMMRELQSSIELSDSLKSLTGSQQLTTAAGLIGKTVTGVNADQKEITGVATRAFVRDGVAYVGVGTEELALSTLTQVRQ